FFVGSDRAEATVVDARDGRLLAKKSVPSPGEWVAAVEGKILRWRADRAGRQIELFDPWSQSVIWSKGPFASNAKWHVLDRECIGVMEPKGRFVLISLRDGQTRVEAQLEPEPTLSEIVLFQLGGSHILVTNGQVHSAGQPNVVFGRQILGASSKTIQKGRVHGFGRSGERLWPDKPQGVSVANQQLLLEQPGWLPILTFAGQRYDQNNREMRWITSVVMIDLRNGRKLIEKEYQAKVPQFRLEGHPEDRAVECAMFGESIRLTFTDKPLAVEEPSKTPLERPGKDADGRRDEDDKKPKTLNAILDAMRKAVGG
ncbi:MAG: hypothetical protein GX621_00215, partial [Pirellulaceae bacterium]|nr:hypothetical protein [Pirellulaceae bacterium]